MVTLAQVESIDVTSSQVVLSDDQKTVTITPSANFSYNSRYYVEVTAGTLKDAYGNGNTAIYGTTNDAALTSWTFGTPNPALQIVKSTPANLADKVAGSAAIVIEFNREVVAGTTHSVGYLIWDGTTEQPKLDPITSTNVTFSGKTMTIWHAEAFPSGKTIFIKLEAGTVVAKNDATITNPDLDRTTTSSMSAPIQFSVDDINPPVPTFTPALFSSSAPVYTAVDSDIILTFDEAIYNYGSGTPVTSGNATNDGLFTISPAVPFSATISNLNKTVTIHPTSGLSEFTSYTVSVVGNKIQDGVTPTAHVITTAVITADNALPANQRKYSSSFMTVDKSAPTVTFAGVAPFIVGGDKQITVPVITVVDPNKSNFYYLLRVKSTAVAPTAAEIKAANKIDATSGTIASFVISSLTASTDYQFYYVADDTFGTTTDVKVLEVSTTDTVAPLLVSTTPASGTVDVNTTGGLIVKLTFNENVAKDLGTTGLITVRDYNSQAILATLTKADLSAVDDKSFNLTIPATTFTAAAQKVYIEISSGTITDVAPALNKYIGISGKDALVLTTEDNAAPTVDLVNSTSGTNVALDASIVVAFSENVKPGTGNLVLYAGTVSTPNAIQVFTPAQATFSGQTATVKPTASLVNGQAYVLGVEEGFAKDLSSNANVNIASTGVTFSATPNVNLFVSTVAPAGGSTAIDKQALAGVNGNPYPVVTFSGDAYLTVAGYHKSLALMTQAELLAHVSLKDAAGSSVTISQIDKVLTSGANGLILRIPVSGLKDQTNYTLTISGFENLAGTVMTTKVVSYLTGDGTAPVITFNPVKNATKVDASSSLTLSFSEKFYADVISGNNSIWAEVNNTNVKSFVALKKGVTAPNFTTTGTDVDFTATISGNVITIVPAAKLESGVVYSYGMTRTVEDITTKAIVLNS
jgi:hypothetical protein